jgi:hypothetical protein
MSSCGMLRRVFLVRTDVSEELSTSIIRVTGIGELVTANVTSSPIPVTLMMDALSSTETAALTRTTRYNFPEGAILHSHRRDNLKSLSTLYCFCIFNILFSYNGSPIFSNVEKFY